MLSRWLLSGKCQNQVPHKALLVFRHFIRLERNWHFSHGSLHSQNHGEQAELSEHCWKSGISLKPPTQSYTRGGCKSEILWGGCKWIKFQDNSMRHPPFSKPKLNKEAFSGSQLWLLCPWISWRLTDRETHIWGKAKGRFGSFFHVCSVFLHVPSLAVFFWNVNQTFLMCIACVAEDCFDYCRNIKGPGVSPSDSSVDGTHKFDSSRVRRWVIRRLLTSMAAHPLNIPPLIQ